MKLFALFVIVLFAGLVYADVESSSSGIFRGSLRYTVDINGEDTVTDVNAGDFISFKLPGVQYTAVQKFEEKDVYIRRYSSNIATYDLPEKKFNELALGDSVVLDVDDDGKDDVRLTFSASKTWVVGPACTVACSSDADCAGTCVNPGSCSSACLAPEPQEPERACCLALIASCLACSEGVSISEYCAENPETAGCQADDVAEPLEDEGGVAPLPPVPEPEESPAEQKGWFTRLLEWFARLV